MSKTLYQYFKSLVDVPSEKLGNWRNILSGLEDAGYKVELSPKSKSRNYRQIEPLVNIVNIGLETNNTITIDIKVRLELPSASDPETPEPESIDEEEEETDRP